MQRFRVQTGNRWFLKSLEPRFLKINIFKTAAHHFNHKSAMKGKNGRLGICLGFSYLKYVPNSSHKELEFNVNDH